MHDSSHGLAGSQHWSSEDASNQEDVIGEQGLPPAMTGRLRTLLQCLQQADRSRVVEHYIVRVAGYIDAMNDTGHHLAAANMRELFEREGDRARARKLP
ncbi:hypothetical protein JNO42_03275 [Pseudomonas putida]|uniref:hypothetical protein n=1 Tax=Pseudomonas putida TaxID=303 RepID=UPI001EF786EE|nr:hypothetical protein [Pseudomonas putida]ULL06048.1 hypothetical protein JNO42_03275 [Pseudomonas putida]